MPTTHRVIPTEQALADLYEIAKYIRERSPQSAAAVADAILQAIDSLDSMPDRFKRVGISRKRRTAVHAMVIRPFLVYYRVDEPAKAVHILHIIHGARRQPRHFD